MKPFVESILARWRHQRAYAERLVAGLDDGQMLAQPVRGVVMNHPAWVLSHLSAYPPILAGMLRREAVEDPIDHPHGRNSQPTADPADYLPPAELVAHYLRTHDEAAGALCEADEAVFGEWPSVERWRERFPTLHDVIVHLMVHHESVHLGQLSAWRRAMGLPAV